MIYVCQAKDILDPAKASAVDFPESVVGLMKGDLGMNTIL